jgi:hypothetical protein
MIDMLSEWEWTGPTLEAPDWIIPQTNDTENEEDE